MSDDHPTTEQEQTQVEPAKKLSLRPFVMLHITCDCGEYDWVRMASMRAPGGVKCRDCRKRLDKSRYVELWRIGATTAEEAIAKKESGIPGRRKFRSGKPEKHGMCKTREYRAWSDMRTRCTNPNFIKYEYYGGKGIKVCDRWLGSFMAFREDMGECPPRHTLDRIESNKDYEPGNCRWVTHAAQMRNTSRTRMYTIGDKTQCLSDWATEAGLSFNCLYKRLEKGMSIEEATTLGVRRQGRRYLTSGDKTLSPAEWERETGIPADTILSRIDRHGWTEHKAVTTPARKKRCETSASPESQHVQ